MALTPLPDSVVLTSLPMPGATRATPAQRDRRRGPYGAPNEASPPEVGQS